MSTSSFAEDSPPPPPTASNFQVEDHEVTTAQSTAWPAKEGSSDFNRPSSRPPSHRSHGSGPPSEHDAAASTDSIVTMSMLQENNDRLVRQLMSMMRSQPLPDEEPEEENVAPVGISSTSSNTVRLMPVDPIPTFDGNREDHDAAASWLRRFEETAVACGWTSKETLRQFGIHTSKSVQNWFTQLRPELKKDWNTLRQRFKKEYVKSPIPKEDLYYYMAQGPNEDVKSYFVRFNAAAIAINLDYRKNRQVLENHINRFSRHLRDQELSRSIYRQQFHTIDDLEYFLDKQHNIEALTKFQPQTYRAQANVSQPNVQVGNRNKGKSAHFIDSRESPPPYYASPEVIEAEIYALGRQTGAAPRRIHCTECGREHYSIDGQCWTNTYCKLCNKMGHPETNCYRACPFCKPPHNKNDRCEVREKVAELKAFLEVADIDGLPPLDCLNF